VIAQLRADKAAAGAKISRWEIVLYTSVGGILFFLIASLSRPLRLVAAN